MHFSQFLIDCLMGCAEVNICVYNDSLKVIVSIQMVPHNIKKRNRLCMKMQIFLYLSCQFLFCTLWKLHLISSNN